MDKNKLISALISALVGVVISFLGNVSAGKALNDPSVVKQAITDGVKAGLVAAEQQATKAKVEEPAKPILVVRPFIVPPALLSYDATVSTDSKGE